MAELCYLLDTDTCIYVINHRPPGVRERFSQLAVGSVAMSVITYHELYFGALNSQRIEQNLQALQALAQRVPAMPWTMEAAACTAKIWLALKRSGQTIGSWDLQIAGHALALSTTLITSNLREFNRVENLRAESWLETDLT